MSTQHYSGKIAQLTQSHFADKRHEAMIGLILLSHQINEKRQNVLKPYDITSQQYNVLRILRGQYPNHLTMQDIRTRMLDKMSDVTRLVERLLKMDLVIRNTSNVDKRVVYVSITKAGLDLLKEIDPHIKTLWDMSNLLNDDIDKLINIIERLLD